MDKSLIERLTIIKKRHKLSYKQLGDIMGVSKDTAGNYLIGRTDPSIQGLKKLAAATNEDEVWLVTGKKDNGHSNSFYINEHDPIYNVRKGKAGLKAVTASYQNHLRMLMSHTVQDLPEAKYDLFEVEGSSMERTLHHGDLLLCQMVTPDLIKDGRIYVLVLDDQKLKEYRPSGIWIKRCTRLKNDFLVCRSDNRDTTESYPTFRIPLSSVHEIWYPVKKITDKMDDPNRDIYDQLDELRDRIEMLESLNE